MLDKIKLEYMRYGVSMSSYLISKSGKEKIKKDFEKWLIDLKKVYRYQNRKKTIIKNIKEKKLYLWATLTLKPHKALDTINSKELDSLRKLFKRYEVDYILVPELHDSGNYHFHGFLGIPKYSKFYKLIVPKIINGKQIFDKHGNQVLEFLPYSKNYGFNQLIDFSIKSENEQKKIINYSVKYTLKSENRLLSSRVQKKPLEIAKSMFGDIVRYKKLDN